MFRVQPHFFTIPFELVGEDVVVSY